MKKAASFRSLARLTSPSLTRSASESTFSRSKSSSSLPEVSEAAHAQAQTDFAESQTQTTGPADFHIPTHEEAHAGPYGVEMPLLGFFVTEVEGGVKRDAKEQPGVSGRSEST